MTAPAAPVWRRKAALAFVDSADRVALVDLDRLAEPPMILAGSGALIWRAVDGRRSSDEVAAVVADECGVPLDQVAGDVLHFLDSLARSGLLEAVG